MKTVGKLELKCKLQKGGKVTKVTYKVDGELVHEEYLFEGNTTERRLAASIPIGNGVVINALPILSFWGRQ